MLITFFCSLHRLFRLIAIHPHTKHVMIEWFRFHNPALVDSLCFNVSTFARKSDHNTPAAHSASCESIKVKLRTFPLSFISSVHSMLIWLPHWDQIFSQKTREWETLLPWGNSLNSDSISNFHLTLLSVEASGIFKPPQNPISYRKWMH